VRRAFVSIGILLLAGGLPAAAALRLSDASTPKVNSDTSTPTASAPQWRVVADSGVPALHDVDALTSRNVWVVGSRVVMRWNGRKLETRFRWTSGGELSAVTAVSINDVWVAGSDGGGRPLAVHFDGRGWRRVTLPPVGQGSLADIHAVHSDDVWAVGSGGGDAARERALVMHFDGERWGIVDVHRASPSPSRLYAIDGTAGDDLWVFGSDGPYVAGAYDFDPLLLRWDGCRWARVRSPGSGYKGWLFGSLDVSPAGDVWTVQQEFSYGGPTFVRRSGPTRGVVTVFSPWEDDVIGGSDYDLAAVSKTSTWAVGEMGMAHWDGRSWRDRPTPKNGASLSAVSAISPTEIWSVGDGLIARYSP
jgi:hypothetical protein